MLLLSSTGCLPLSLTRPYRALSLALASSASASSHHATITAPDACHIQHQHQLVAMAGVLEGIGIPSLKAAAILKRHERTFISTSLADLRARVHALEQQLETDNQTLAKVLQKRPMVLFLNLQESMQPFMLLLQSLGIERKPFLGKIMAFNPYAVIKSGEQSVLRFLDLCKTCGLSSEEAANCMRRSPLVAVFASENMFSVLNFLEEFGITPTEMGKMLKEYPCLITRSVEDGIKPVVKYFEDIGFERAEIMNILRKDPRIVGFSVEENLKPKVRYLMDLGFKRIDIVKLVIWQPSIFRRSVNGNFNVKVKFLLELGFEMGSPSFCRSLGFIASCSMDYLKERICWFTSLGLSQEDIFTMLRGNPSLFKKRLSSLDEKFVYLDKVMQYPLTDVVTHPVFLNLSLEKRIRPRHRVVTWLKSMEFLEDTPSLAFYTCLDNWRFRKKYVDCYPGCSLVFENERP